MNILKFFNIKDINKKISNPCNKKYNNNFELLKLKMRNEVMSYFQITNKTSSLKY